MVSAVGVDGEGAEDFSGGGVDDANVVAVDEHEDGGSVVGLPDADVVQFPVDPQAHGPGVDFVGAHPGFAVSACSGGAGRACFGSGLVGDGGGCPVRQGPVWALVVVVVDEFVDLGLQLRNGSRSRLGGEPFRHGLLEAFNFPARGRVVRS